MINAVQIIAVVIALALGPKDMTEFSVAFQQPTSDNISFKAEKQVDMFWLVKDPRTQVPTWFQVEGDELRIRNERGQTAIWPIPERIDMSSLKTKADTHTLPVLQPKDTPPIVINREGEGWKIEHKGGFLPSMTVTFEK